MGSDQVKLEAPSTDGCSLPDHIRYREQIKKAHGRKLGFWSLVK